MENMDLNNAEVAVTTQHILDGKEYKDYRVQMSTIAIWENASVPAPTSFPKKRTRSTDIPDGRTYPTT